MSKPRNIRVWINRITGLLMIALVLGAAVFYIWLNTSRGLEWASRKLYSATGGIVQLTGLAGRLPFHLSARQLILRDHKLDEWLVARDLEARTNLRALLQLELSLADTRIGSVEWLTFPDFRASRDPAIPATAPYKRILPGALHALRLENAAIDHFVIHTNIIRHEFSGSLQGNARWHGEDDVYAKATGPVLVDRVSSNIIDAVFLFENGQLVFPQLDIKAAGRPDTFAGTATYTIRTRALASTGELSIADAAWYQPFHHLDLQGPLELRFSANHAARGLPWLFDVQASSGGFAFYSFTNTTMHGSGSLSLTRDQTVYRMDYSAAAAAVTNWSFEHVAIHTSGTNTALSLEVSGEGQHETGHAFSLDARHEITGDPEARRWLIETPRASGSLNQQPLRLGAPASYMFSNDTHQLTIPLLELAGGSSSLAMLVQSNRMTDARARLSDVSVAGLAGLLNHTNAWIRPETIMNLDLAASGLASSPQASTTIQVLHIESPHTLLRPFSGASITLTGHLDHAGISAQATFSHPLVRMFQISATGGSVPLDRFIPLGLDLDRGVTAQIQLQSELSRISSEMIATPASLGGQVEMDMTISQLPRQPVFQGTFLLRDGQLRHITTGTFLEDLHARLYGRENKLIIDVARASDGSTGTLEAKGMVSFDRNWTPAWDAQLELNRISLFRPIKSDLPLTGTVVSKGDAERASVNGNVWLEPSVFLIPKRLPPDIRMLDVKEINHPDANRNSVALASPEPAKKAHQPGRPFEFNLAVQTRDLFEVKGRGLQSEWKGFVQLGGDSRNPSLTGTNAILKGYAMLLGRRFNIDRGQIIFTGEIPPEPRLNVEASTRIGEVVARLIVSGTTANPKVILASEPMLPENEIMSIILFGKSTETMSPWQAIALANGLRVLGGQGGDLVEILDAGQNVLRLDQIDVKQDEDGKGFSSLSVGKYIGSALYIEGEKGMGGSEDRFTASLELSKRLVLETETSPRIREGVRLLWRRDY